MTVRNVIWSFVIFCATFSGCGQNSESQSISHLASFIPTGGEVAPLPTQGKSDLKEIRAVRCTWLHPQFGEREVDVTVISGDLIRVNLFEGEPPFFATITDFDAPEIDQPFGQQAADRLAELLENERVSAGPPTKEAQKAVEELQRGAGRRSDEPNVHRPSWVLLLNRKPSVLVAEVLAGEGLGWWTGQSLSSPGMSMRKAMKAKKGLWSKADPIAPWVWRELTESQKAVFRD